MNSALTATSLDDLSALQLLEMTRFRLTSAFRLSYTHFTGTLGYPALDSLFLTPMTFLSRILRFLFWLLLVSWSVWLVRRLLGSLFLTTTASPEQAAKGSASSEARKAARRLVRDPVCGMYVDETLSIPMREGDELLHFCSIACRDAYVVSSKKFAANG
jgi:YHS domain-containing protein